MRSWLILLSGPLIWALHFFFLYGIGEFGGSTRGPRSLVAGLTLLGLAAAAGIARSLVRAQPSDDFDRWVGRLGLAGLGLGAVAIVWQTLPIFFGGAPGF